MTKFLGIAGLVVAAGVFGGSSLAQITGNARPITIIVPYTSGASVDATLRLLTNKISEQTGQSFAIENRSGSGGVPAALAVMAAKPDGSTLFHVDLAHVTIQALSRNIPFDLNRDFEPITTIWTLTYLLAVPVDSSIKTVADIVEKAKQPGGVSFASPGFSTGPQLLPEMMRVKSGGSWTHVPYRGASPAMIDLIAGRVDMMYVSYAAIKGFLREGKVRVIAIVAPQRSMLLPEVPTMSEAGFPEIQLETCSFGLVAPRNTPDAVIAALHQAFVRAASEPDFVKSMNEEGIRVTTISPSEFRKLIARDTERLQELARVAGLSSP